MKGVLPYLGMVCAQLAQVGLMVVSKKAMSSGMSNFTFVFYSNALASLILLPSSFLFHRSPRPPLNFPLLSGFLLLGVLGFLAQIFGYTGIQYSSATLNSAMLNLIPGFTFVLAIMFRMENVDFRRSSTLAKVIGTLVSIAGAFMVSLYKGPVLIPNPSISNLSISNLSHLLLSQSSNWVIGGLLLAVDSVFSSSYIIVQALVLKKCPAELIVIFAYCFIVAIISAAVSLLVERDLSAWSLQPNIRWLGLLYSGVFGSAFQVTVSAWCLKRKGPLFVAMFHPLGIVIATFMDSIFSGDAFYLGSLVGSIVIVVGFYSVMWGNAKEGKMVEVNLERSTQFASDESPLLQNGC